MNLKLYVKISFLFLIVLFSACEKEYTGVFDPIQNIPPVISNLSAPDSLTVLPQDTVLILLSIRASDANGLDDIKSVFFNSYRSDGTPSSGNPFEMFDDGNRYGTGDITKGDGVYSRIVILPPGTTPGLRRFDFQAVDKSFAYSNVISHNILVK